MKTFQDSMDERDRKVREQPPVENQILSDHDLQISYLIGRVTRLENDYHQFKSETIRIITELAGIIDAMRGAQDEERTTATRPD